MLKLLDGNKAALPRVGMIQMGTGKKITNKEPKTIIPVRLVSIVCLFLRHFLSKVYHTATEIMHFAISVAVLLSGESLPVHSCSRLDIICSVTPIIYKLIDKDDIVDGNSA